MTPTLKKRGPKGPSIGSATLAELMLYLKPNEAVPVNNKWLTDQRAKHSPIAPLVSLPQSEEATISIIKLSLDDEE